MKHITLITGGIKSGKSSYALKLAHETGANRAFIATAEAFDEDMKARIARHRGERGADFHTIEEPLDLVAALKNADGCFDCIVIDCLTLWLNNLYLNFAVDGKIEETAILSFRQALSEVRTPVIIVTNEVGLGIIPVDAAARHYMDHLGRLNAQIASLADDVMFMISGIPQKIKGITHVPIS